MIPTSIDGTDITGATIDGTDVTEITVDGDTVFTAEEVPLGRSNLVAWYPFENGVQDETAAGGILGGQNVGDATDYTPFSNNATFKSSSGVTDVNNGANSGCFEFSGGQEMEMTNPLPATGGASVMCWATIGNYDYQTMISDRGGGGNDFAVQNSNSIFPIMSTADQRPDITGDVSLNTFHHFAKTFDNGISTAYIDGQQLWQVSGTTRIKGGNMYFGYSSSFNPGYLDGFLDDVRFYNRGLTGPEINQIYQNTQP